jgi:hypothetical protein
MERLFGTFSSVSSPASNIDIFKNNTWKTKKGRLKKLSALLPPLQSGHLQARDIIYNQEKFLLQ